MGFQASSLWEHSNTCWQVYHQCKQEYTYFIRDLYSFRLRSFSHLLNEIEDNSWWSETRHSEEDSRPSCFKDSLLCANLGDSNLLSEIFILKHFNAVLHFNSSHEEGVQEWSSTTCDGTHSWVNQDEFGSLDCSGQIWKEFPQNHCYWDWWANSSWISQSQISVSVLAASISVSIVKSCIEWLIEPLPEDSVEHSWRWYQHSK